VGASKLSHLNRWKKFFFKFSKKKDNIFHADAKLTPLAPERMGESSSALEQPSSEVQCRYPIWHCATNRTTHNCWKIQHWNLWFARHATSPFILRRQRYDRQTLENLINQRQQQKKFWPRHQFDLPTNYVHLACVVCEFILVFDPSRKSSSGGYYWLSLQKKRKQTPLSITMGWRRC
jgi:hypothetical protein